MSGLAPPLLCNKGVIYDLAGGLQKKWARALRAVKKPLWGGSFFGAKNHRDPRGGVELVIETEKIGGGLW
ncbi:MAG: hypothetical protein GYA48_14220 [Chloroflexi bacterium]|nr:hypothetical protein [Chloroflexota bacterium]